MVRSPILSILHPKTPKPLHPRSKKQHQQRVDWVDRYQVEPPAEQVEKLTLRVQKAVQIHGFYGPQKPVDGHIIGGA